MNDSLFTDEPPPNDDLFTDEPAPEEKSVGGFLNNLRSDVVDTAKGIGHLAENLVVDPGETIVQTAKSLPGAVVDEAKRLGAGELLTLHPINAANKFGNAMYDKPMTTVLDVLPAVGAAGKALGIGGKAAKALDLAGGVTKTLEGAGAVDELAQAAKASVPMGATFQETVSNLAKKIPDEVKQPFNVASDFVNQKYERAAANPNFREMAGDAMIRKAQGMRFRELGGTAGQARKLTQKIGEDGLRELMDVAKAKGITDSPIGAVRRKATKALEESSGKAIGGMREMAAKRGAVHDANSLVEKIKSRLDKDYLGEGIASGQKGVYQKALEDIRSAASSPDKLAKKISEMNRMATKDKMTQPTGAITDVANEASRLNNELIKKHLAPKEIQFYEEALRDFGASKIFQKLQSFEVGREMGGRGSGGFLRNLKQTAMDMGGDKVLENFYDRFGPRLKSTDISRNLSTLTEGAIDDILGALDDAIDEVVR